MDLGIVSIINSQPVFSNPKDNNVKFVIADRFLQLSPSSSSSPFALDSSSRMLAIPYGNIDNIIISDNVFTLNLSKNIDTQLGSIGSLNLLAPNPEQVFKYILPLGRKNPKITVHSISDFQSDATANTRRTSEHAFGTNTRRASEPDITESMSDLSISSNYYGRIDTIPSSVFNCNVYIDFNQFDIHFHNRRGYDFHLNYSNLNQIDVFESGLYLHTHELIYPFNEQGYNILALYTSEPQTVFMTIKSHY